ncbi:carboxypeptidase regulatory-like domain-containing protein [Aeromicrobium wangtongii]|uniref:carboxypeptidase regulatory-like domain-containing protein n=1 Tax=Aeromicrobium wangtongii TaxID=2969247 RepID=UPI002017B284|nr:carboxypeptidase regulatory-like domain-containing protein [Aeromicrobium wangtongii]MCL3819561.1 carboxypeptidase regulatory-like domain-containing protein [Aeromicrobium wangtongii]
MASRSSVRTCVGALLALFALIVAGLVSPATAATSTGKLKGVITLNGAPVNFAKVQLYRSAQDEDGDDVAPPTRLKTDNTDSSGRYSFSGLKVKDYNYTLLVTDRTGKAVKTSRSIRPKAGKTVTDNVHLKLGATVRGALTTSDGRSPAGLTVGVKAFFGNERGGEYDKFFPALTTTVKADGTFRLSGLPGADYDAAFVADGPKVEQCYDLVTGSLAECAKNDPVQIQHQKLTLAAGEVRTLPTVTVTKFAPPATRLTGKVTDTSGKALKGIKVRLSSPDDGTKTFTRSSGRFTVNEALRAGTYTVRYDDPKNVWASQYLGGGPDKSVRQTVVVTPGQPVRNLDTKLKSIATAKISTTPGNGSAKVAFQIKRKATGSAPSGTLTLSYQSISKTVTVAKGKATVKLSGLPKGTLSLVADYSGTGSTAEFSKIVKVTVR